GELLSYERVLNLRTGKLTRSFRLKSPAGRTIEVRYARFTSLADRNLMAIRCQITPLDFSGPIELHAALHGNVENAGVAHWNKVEQGARDAQTIFLQSATRQTGIMLCEAARLTVVGADAAYAVQEHENAPTVVARWQAQQGQTV